MNLELLEEYSTDISTVIAMFLDEDYHRRKIVEGRGGRNFELIEHSESEDLVSFKMTYEADVELPESFPRKYRKYVKSENSFTSVVRWSLNDSDATAQGAMSLSIEGMPLEVKGTYFLVTTENGCQREISVNIKYKVPVIGKVISKIFSGNIKKMLEDEYEFNLQLLEKM